MEIEKREIKDLHLAGYNPRKITDKNLERLKNNINEFGYIDPVIINKDNTVIGGHQRIKVLKELGITEIDCSIVDISKDKEKALNISLNNPNLQGEWEEEKLAELLKELEEKDLTDLTGFEDKEVSQLLDLLKEVEEDDFEEPTEPKYKVKRGDLFQLGQHKLLCGDSTCKEDIEKLMGGGKADMVFTDPPFNINYQSLAGQGYSTGKYKSKKIFSDKLSEKDYLEFLRKALKNCYNFTQDKSVVFLWNGDRFLDIAMRACKEENWKINQLAVWVKNSFVFSPGCVFHKFLEYCVIAFKNGKKPKINKNYAKYHGNLLDLDFNSFLEHLEGWYAHRDSTVKYQHPTQKPVRLAEPALRACSEERDIILDLFGGSGSTLITAEQMNRKAYLVELDPKYVSLIIERWEKLTGQKHIRL